MIGIESWTTVVLHFKWNIFFRIYESYFTLKVCMRIEIAKP